MLERQGVVVDAYLDLKDRTIKGPGITEKNRPISSYGEKPLISAAATLENEPADASRPRCDGQDGRDEKQSGRSGGQPVLFRRFLLLMGYKLPEGRGYLGYQRVVYLRGTQTKGKDDSTTPKEDKPK